MQAVLLQYVHKTKKINAADMLLKVQNAPFKFLKHHFNWILTFNCNCTWL